MSPAALPPAPARPAVTIFDRGGLVVVGSPLGGPPVLALDSPRLTLLAWDDALALADALLKWAGPHIAAQRAEAGFGLPAEVVGPCPVSEAGGERRHHERRQQDRRQAA